MTARCVTRCPADLKKRMRLAFQFPPPPLDGSGTAGATVTRCIQLKFPLILGDLPIERKSQDRAVLFPLSHERVARATYLYGEDGRRYDVVCAGITRYDRRGTRLTTHDEDAPGQRDGKAAAGSLGELTLLPEHVGPDGPADAAAFGGIQGQIQSPANRLVRQRLDDHAEQPRGI